MLLFLQYRLRTIDKVETTKLRVIDKVKTMKASEIPIKFCVD